MTYQTLSELILLLLLAISAGRIFFIKNARLDPLSAVPLITLIFSMLQFFAFGLSIFEVLIFFLAFSLTIWNVRALARFKAKLVVDHYGILFVLISILNLILIIIVGVFAVLYRPVRIDMKKFNVDITTKSYSGSLDEAYSEYENPVRPKSASVKKYESKNAEPDEPKKIIAFIPSESSRLEFYEPFFAKLARDGYTVYAASFPTTDVHYFNSVLDVEPFRSSILTKYKYLGHKNYDKAMENKEKNLVREFTALLKLIPTGPQDSIFLVGDTVPHTAYLSATLNTTNKAVKGSFDLGTIPGYYTAGYGPVESGYPVFAKLLGYERDGTFYMASHIAGKLESYIQESLSVKTEMHPHEIETESDDTENLTTNAGDESDAGEAL